jgi:hypothetical protein
VLAPGQAIVFRYFALFAQASAMSVAQRSSSTVSHSAWVAAFRYAPDFPSFAAT